MPTMERHPVTGSEHTKQEEWRTFLFLALVMAPLLAVIVVGGYGFVVWMYQILSGQLPGG